MRRIGVLVNLGKDDPLGQARQKAFVQGLQALGWTEGRNVQIDTRWGEGDAGQFRKYAAELIALEPDVILATSGATMPALMQATRTVPIVFVQVPDRDRVAAARMDVKEWLSQNHHLRRACP
jgi:putative ABC transport system substrate-binding protein